MTRDMNKEGKGYSNAYPSLYNEYLPNVNNFMANNCTQQPGQFSPFNQVANPALNINNCNFVATSTYNLYNSKHIMNNGYSLNQSGFPGNFTSNINSSPSSFVLPEHTTTDKPKPKKKKQESKD